MGESGRMNQKEEIWWSSRKMVAGSSDVGEWLKVVGDSAGHLFMVECEQSVDHDIILMSFTSPAHLSPPLSLPSLTWWSGFWDLLLVGWLEVVKQAPELFSHPVFWPSTSSPVGFSGFLLGTESHCFWAISSANSRCSHWSVPRSQFWGCTNPVGWQPDVVQQFWWKQWVCLGFVQHWCLTGHKHNTFLPLSTKCHPCLCGVLMTRQLGWKLGGSQEICAGKWLRHRTWGYDEILTPQILWWSHSLWTIS